MSFSIFPDINWGTSSCHSLYFSKNNNSFPLLYISVITRAVIGQFRGPYSIVLKKLNSFFNYTSVFTRAVIGQIQSCFCCCFAIYYQVFSTFIASKNLNLSCILNCVLKCANDLTVISNWLSLLLMCVNLKLKFETVPRDRNRSRIRQTHIRDIINILLNSSFCAALYVICILVFSPSAVRDLWPRELRVYAINRQEKTRFVTKYKPRTRLLRGI